MKLLLLLASLLCYSNAKQLLRVNQQGLLSAEDSLQRVGQHALMSAEDSAFMGAQIEKHIRSEADAKGLGVTFAWDPPTLMLDDQAHGTCVKAKVKLQLGMKKQLQGETGVVDTKSLNVDVEFGTSFIDQDSKPNIIPFLIVKVTILPFAKMFEKGFKAVQAAMKAAGIANAASATSFKAMAIAAKGKLDKIKSKAPALAKLLEVLASKTEFGEGLGPTNQGFAWTFALEDSEYKNGRPSVTFEWRPKAGSNSLTTMCIKIPAGPPSPAPYGASVGTCGAHPGINFQFGLSSVDLGAAFMGWLLPGGVTDAKYKGKDVKECLVKIKDAVKKNIADAKKSPGLIKKFLQTVGKAIMGGKLEFFAELRFGAFMAVKVSGDVPIKNFVKGDAEKGKTE